MLETADSLAAKEFCSAMWAATLENEQREVVVIVPLMFHVSVLVNPRPIGGYDERYCFHNEAIAHKAIAEYETTGVFRYWKKWHSRGVYISGTHAYRDGLCATPENALYSVDWDLNEIEAKYVYSPFLQL